METVTVAEKVAVAMSRSNLTYWQGGIDKIIALGFAGLDLKRSKRGGMFPGSVILGAMDAVFGLKYANDASYYKPSLLVVERVAKRCNARWNWRLKRLRPMSKKVLDYWLNDICSGCEGRQFEVVEGTPMLMDRACRQCGGTGRKRYPWGEDEKHKRLLSTVEHLEALVIGAVARRIRPQRKPFSVPQ
jgi:hypothetical protein